MTSLVYATSLSIHRILSQSRIDTRSRRIANQTTKTPRIWMTCFVLPNFLQLKAYRWSELCSTFQVITLEYLRMIFFSHSALSAVSFDIQLPSPVHFLLHLLPLKSTYTSIRWHHIKTFWHVCWQIEYQSNCLIQNNLPYKSVSYHHWASSSWDSSFRMH